MRTFTVDWHSPHNIEKGTVIVKALSLVEAQDKFLEWIKKQSIYSHMWRLSFEFTESDTQYEVIE